MCFAIKCRWKNSVFLYLFSKFIQTYLRQKHFQFCSEHFHKWELVFSYEVTTERKVGHHCNINSQSQCDKEYEDFFLICRCFYLVDEETVFCNVLRWCRGKRCENYRGTRLKLTLIEIISNYVQNMFQHYWKTPRAFLELDFRLLNLKFQFQ